MVMSKTSTHYICQSCGAVHSKWSGRCDACGEWNTLTEEAFQETPKGLKQGKKTKGLEFASLDDAPEDLPRSQTTISELDRVLGGGLVPGSAVLIGGDPGIGKSTLLLQAAALLGRGGARVAYISGEESIAQIQMRARRMLLLLIPCRPCLSIISNPRRAQWRRCAPSAMN
jgi:DNA repair protein RadA/Sms